MRIFVLIVWRIFSSCKIPIVLKFHLIVWLAVQHGGAWQRDSSANHIHASSVVNNLGWLRLPSKFFIATMQHKTKTKTKEPSSTLCHPQRCHTLPHNQTKHRNSLQNRIEVGRESLSLLWPVLTDPKFHAKRRRLRESHPWPFAAGTKNKNKDSVRHIPVPVITTLHQRYNNLPCQPCRIDLWNILVYALFFKRWLKSWRGPRQCCSCWL